MADTRKVVYLLNRCFLDDTHTRNYTDPRKLRDHLQDAHDYQFPLKIKSTRRYNNDRFLYLRHRDDSQLTSVNYACPCCKGHFKDTKELANHFLALHKVHLP
ncbi:uncharacterized protein BYT42DRAFT_492440, partial [Radiomyces spectabilis]|uniref:uncharacterized protein n=1 Tax=Radiomyces spectabilis TaxID=64574 RepID=UPI00221ECA82